MLFATSHARWVPPLTCQEQITFLQRHDTRNMLNELRNLENHILGVSILPHCVVCLEPQVDIVWVGDLRSWNESRDGREGVESLGGGPWETCLFHLVLHVASGHIDSECISSNV